MEEKALTTKQSQPLVSTHKQGQIAYILTDINDCLSFDVSASKLANWAKVIDSEIPDLNLNELSESIRAIATGSVEIKPNEGVQNIFRSLSYLGYYRKMKMVY